ncbi:MAG: response regulator transcription factor [Pirellulales bacterium]
MYTLLIVEPREVLRLGLRAALADTDIRIVAEAVDGEGAYKAVAKHRPDVVLLAVVLNEGDGLSVLGRLRRDHPECRVVLYADQAWPTYVAAAIAGDACGLATIDEDPIALTNRLRTAAQGRTTWTSRDRRRADGKRSQLFGRIALTRREIEIVSAVARGRTNAEIATEADVSPDTVKEHLSRLMIKLGVGDRTQATVWAVRQGLGPRDMSVEP